MLTTLGLVFLLGQQNFIGKKIGIWLDRDIPGAYFHTLVSSKENHSWLSRKLILLPEVKYVHTLPREKIVGEVKNILENLDVGGLENILELDYVGLKVVFEKTVSDRTQNLVREYMGKLVGKDKLMMGAIKKTATLDSGPRKLLSGIGAWFYPALLGVVFIFWLFSLWSFSYRTVEVSYIIEQYQRKTNVSAKIMLTGFLSVVVFSIVPTCLVGSPQFINFCAIGLLFVLILAIGLRKCAWNS
ncbi:MAG: hypothetical protein KAQ98_03260 [Bacteriovoracaceae bacterium]|nr:hypothetical protein [Bacteriovoracaceae bacterium]